GLVVAIFGGMAENGVLAGDVRETAKVGGVRELRATGLHALVAARADGEAVALGDRAHRRLEKGQHRNPVRHVMAEHFSAPTRVRAGRPVQRAEGEPAGGETAEARGGEGPVAQKID